MSDACECPGPMDLCPRFQRPVKGRIYELCAGKNCTAAESEFYRSQLAADRDESSNAQPASAATVAQPPGLGDAVESALAKLGITKAKVKEWLGAPCGCKERQEKLNKLGRWAKRIMGRQLPPPH